MSAVTSNIQAQMGLDNQPQNTCWPILLFSLSKHRWLKLSNTATINSSQTSLSSEMEIMHWSHPSIQRHRHCRFIVNSYVTWMDFFCKNWSVGVILSVSSIHNPNLLIFLLFNFIWNNVFSQVYYHSIVVLDRCEMGKTYK